MIVPGVPDWLVRNIVGKGRCVEGGVDLLLMHKDVEFAGHGVDCRQYHRGTNQCVESEEE